MASVEISDANVHLSQDGYDYLVEMAQMLYNFSAGISEMIEEKEQLLEELESYNSEDSEE